MALDAIGPYRIEHRLAAGGMAEVFVARRLGPHGFKKRVALKRILPQHARDAEFVGMFIDEARLAARLEHPGIVQVFDFGEHGGALFMAMELVEGTTVGRLLRTIAAHRETVPLGPALHIAHEAACALAYAHELTDDDGNPLRLVHRDVSPANLLIDRRGRVKLTDFGIARCRTTTQRTDDGHIRGKLGYMSPEQVVGEEVDAKSDIFTLGVVLAELMIAEPLFAAGADLDVLLQIRNVDLTVLRRAGTHIPRDVVQLVEWMLSGAREDRPSAARLERVLRDILVRRGELGRGPRDLAALLERLDLIPRRAHEREDAGSRPTFLVELDESKPAPSNAKALLDRLEGAEPSMYELRGVDGEVEEAVAYSEMVRRIVTGELAPGTKVRKDRGEFGSAHGLPELRRYLDSKALQWGPSGPPRGAHKRGLLHAGRLLREAHSITEASETGALHLWDGRRQKRIYFRGGQPDFVASNMEAELLGRFLVEKNVILAMELEMALALLPRYHGRLGDALVGLGILRPMALFNAVSEQVRSRYLEAFRWPSGQWAFVRGEQSGEETIPLRQAARELLAEAAYQPEKEQLEAAVSTFGDSRLAVGDDAQRMLPLYKLPPSWERMILDLDGRATAQALIEQKERAGELEATEALRALYFGYSCELIKAA
ncbi:MAG: serine/threonine protein kinase [Sandaracinaceae bacterium]